jgi:hypothetical protein
MGNDLTSPLIHHEVTQLVTLHATGQFVFYREQRIASSSDTLVSYLLTCYATTDHISSFYTFQNNTENAN